MDILDEWFVYIYVASFLFADTREGGEVVWLQSMLECWNAETQVLVVSYRDGRYLVI